MENMMREKQINTILRHIHDLSISPLQSSGVVSMNLNEEQVKYFTFGKDEQNLFAGARYKKVLFALLRDYDEAVKRVENVGLGADGLFDYIDSHFSITNLSESDYGWILGLLPDRDKGNNEAIVDAYYIVLMIQQSIMTDSEQVYQNLFVLASDNDRRTEIKNAIASQPSVSVGFGR